jgi:hypothetical protein
VIDFSKEKQMYKLSDSVSMRLVQIFQEAIMTGCDGADLLRQVRLQVSDKECDTLVLTPEYVKLVKQTHDELEKRAAELQASGGNYDPHAD